MSSQIIKECKINRGTFGIVYKVHEKEEPNKQLALKRNIKDSCYDFSYSIRELDILVKSIEHPNIIKLKSLAYNVNLINFPTLKEQDDVLDDEIHFVFELASCDLADYIDKSRILFPKQSSAIHMLNIFCQILLGVKFLHNNMIVHRDLKPNNILIFKDERGIPVKAKISDFGMSKKYTYQETQSPNVMSYMYRPPEILIEKRYDTRADMWCLGCIFYEMIFHKNFIMCTVKNQDKLTQGEKINVLNHILYKSSKPINESTKAYLSNIKYNVQVATKARKSFYDRLSSYYTYDYLNELRHYNFNPSILIDLMEKLLIISPHERYDITSALDHQLFSPLASKINKYEEVFPKTKKSYLESEIKIYNCYERGLLISTIVNLRQNRYDEPVDKWYCDRIAFHALNIVDKYIFDLREKIVKRKRDKYKDEFTKLEHESEEEHLKRLNRIELAIQQDENLFDEDDDRNKNKCLTFIYISLYMCIKYFSRTRIKYYRLVDNNLLSSPDYLELAKYYEDEILKKNNYQFYSHTLYEIADLYRVFLEEADIVELIKLYSKMSGKRTLTTTHVEMFEYFYTNIYKLSPEERDKFRNSPEYGL